MYAIQSQVTVRSCNGESSFLQITFGMVPENFRYLNRVCHTKAKPCTSKQIAYSVFAASGYLPSSHKRHLHPRPKMLPPKHHPRYASVDCIVLYQALKKFIAQMQDNRRARNSTRLDQLSRRLPSPSSRCRGESFRSYVHR